MKRLGVVLSLAVVLALCLSPVQADLLYSNFDPAVPFTNGSIAISGSSAFIGYNASAQPFTVSGGDFNLTNVMFGGSMDMGTNSVTVSVFSNSEVNRPGNLLWSVNCTGLQYLFPAVVTANFGGSKLLQNGLTYWVGVLPGAMNTMGGWTLVNDNSAKGPSAFLPSGDGNWESSYGTLRAMRVNADKVGPQAAVPEPAALVLGAMGLSGVLLRRRR